MRIRDVSSQLTSYEDGGVSVETSTGALLRSSAADGTARIYRSTDDGKNWTLKQSMSIVTGFTGVRGHFIDSRGYIYFGGFTQTTYEAYTRFAEVWQSKDDGLTWAKVITGESSSFWHFAEDSTHRVYSNEYSTTPTTGTEYPALNIWRSNTSGDSFTKWHTATGETAPGLLDGVRHIHSVDIDSSDRVYAVYGDDDWGGLAGHVVRINSAGAVDIDYGDFGNGCTSIMPTTDGRILFGRDTDPSGISIANPTVALSCQQINLRAELGATYDSYIFDLVRGSSGDVIFGLANPPNSVRLPFLIYSIDEGTNWDILYFGNPTVRPGTISINPSAPKRRIYLGGNPVGWLPEPTAAQLRKRHFA